MLGLVDLPEIRFLEVLVEGVVLADKIFSFLIEVIPLGLGHSFVPELGNNSLELIFDLLECLLAFLAFLDVGAALSLEG